MEHAAALDEQRQHVALPEQHQQRIQVHAPARVRRQHRDLRARRLDRRAPCLWRSIRRCDQRRAANHVRAVRLTQHGRVRGRSPPRVGDDAQRLAVGEHTAGPRRQLRVIEQHIVDAAENRIDARPKRMSPCARRVARDPARVAACRRDLAVERRRKLRDHERKAGRLMRDVRLDQSSGLRRAVADRHFDAGFPQLAHAAAGDLRIRIEHRDVNRGHTSRDQRVGTGPRAADERMRLQRDVRRGASRGSAGSLKRHNFGMLPGWRLRRARRDHATVPHDHASHCWIRTRRPDHRFRPGKRLRHKVRDHRRSISCVLAVTAGAAREAAGTAPPCGASRSRSARAPRGDGDSPRPPIGAAPDRRARGGSPRRADPADAAARAAR